MKRNSKKISILVVTSTFPRWKNDSEPPFVFELCKRLCSQGVTVDVLAPHTVGAEVNEILEEINVSRFRYFFSKFERLAYNGGILPNLKKSKLNYLLIPFFILFQFFAIRKQLKLKEYDLIHAHWLIPQGFLCILAGFFSRKTKPSVICTFHGSDVFSLQSVFLSCIKKWTITKLDKITVVSNYMKKYCIDKYSAESEKILIQPMGVDLINKFKPVSGIEREKNKLIFVGRLVQVKGVLYLVEAISHIVKEYPDIQLVIVGEGPLKKIIQKKVIKLNLSDNIKIIGSVNQEELPSLYSSASIMIAPSIIDESGAQEGLGLSIIEAIACGCHIIASDIEGIKETVNGYGYLVKPSDSQAIAVAIKEYLQDETKFIKDTTVIREKLISKYDWEQVSKQYYELISAL